MLGFEYESLLTYSYNVSNLQIIKVLKNDDLQNYEIQEDQKIIHYKIKNSKYIRLSNLCYLMEIKYVKLTMAQIIQLCLSIIEKLNQLKQQNIQHQYLSTDRIWIQISSDDDQLSLIQKHIKYTIHFAGYSCPFYEMQKYDQLSDDDAIQKIIISILQGSKKYLNQSVLLELDKNKIFQKLLENGIFKNIDSFVNQTQQIFAEFKNLNNEQQMLLKIDTDFSSNEQSRVQSMKTTILNLQSKYYKPDEWYLYEHLLYKNIPELIKNIKSTFSYFQPISLELQQLNNAQNIFDIDENILNQCFENELHKQQMFNFDINEQDIKNEIIIESNYKLNMLKNYFKNNYQFNPLFNNEIQFLIKQQKEKLIQNVVQITIEAIMNIKKLQLIDDAY